MNKEMLNKLSCEEKITKMNKLLNLFNDLREYREIELLNEVIEELKEYTSIEEKINGYKKAIEENNEEYRKKWNKDYDLYDVEFINDSLFRMTLECLLSVINHLSYVLTTLNSQDL